jgi:hypothetical protein
MRFDGDKRELNELLKVVFGATPRRPCGRAPRHLQPNTTRLMPLRIMVGALRARNPVNTNANRSRLTLTCVFEYQETSLTLSCNAGNSQLVVNPAHPLIQKRKQRLMNCVGSFPTKYCRCTLNKTARMSVRKPLLLCKKPFPAYISSFPAQKTRPPLLRKPLLVHWKSFPARGKRLPARGKRLPARGKRLMLRQMLCSVEGESPFLQRFNPPLRGRSGRRRGRA